MEEFQCLSIVIPVYNERDTILEVIQRVKQADSCELEEEIIIIDDGSATSPARRRTVRVGSTHQLGSGQPACKPRHCEGTGAGLLP